MNGIIMGALYYCSIAHKLHIAQLVRKHNLNYLLKTLGHVVLYMDQGVHVIPNRDVLYGIE